MAALFLIYLFLSSLARLPVGIDLVVVALPLADIALWVLPVIVFIMAVWVSATWIEDRAVGTMGIVVASLGVLGEAYQFTVQLVASV